MNAATVRTEDVCAADIILSQVLLIRDGLNRVRSVTVLRIDPMGNGGRMIWCTSGFHFQVGPDALFTRTVVEEMAVDRIDDGNCSARCRKSQARRCRCGCAGRGHGLEGNRTCTPGGAR